MRKLALGISLATVVFATNANASISYTLGSGHDFSVFDNAVIGSTSGTTETDEGLATWTTTAANPATNVTVSGVDLAPYGDTSTFLYATTNANVTIAWTHDVYSFDIYWGSPDWYNTLTLSNGDSVNGTEIQNLSGLSPGSDTAVWVHISDTTAFTGFTASSSAPAFEFDMSAPEPSTWAMMGLGFAALGFAGFRSSAGRRSAIA